MKMTHEKKVLILKVVALVFLILISLFPLQDSPSVEAKTAVTVVAFDKEDDKTQMFVQMTIPQQLAEGSSKMLVVEAEGKDIADVFERMSIKIGLDVELAHCGIIIIGEEMSKKGFIEDLDYLLSSSMVSPQITLFTCDSKAKDFMQKLNEFSQTNGSGVFDVAAFSENSINIRIISALKFLSENNLPSGSSSIPIIGFEMQDGGGGSGGGSDSGGGGGSSSGSSGGSTGMSGGGGENSGGGGGSENPTLKELNTCTLYKDGKAVGTMSPLGTKGLSMFDSKSNKGYFEADNVKIGNKIISYVPMQVRKKSGKLKAEFKDGKPIITAEVNMKLETETRFMISKTGEFASKEEVKEALQKRIEEIVKSEIEEALKICDETGADVLGIETAFYKQCYEQYKKYAGGDDFVKNVQVEYKINAEVV